MHITSSAVQANRIAIGADRAVSVMIEPGAAIQCVNGTVWLTQEGDTRDYCIPAGVTFCADRLGQAVLSAIDAPALVVVHRSDQSGCSRPRFTIDSIERLTNAARAAQSAYMAKAVARVLKRIAIAIRATAKALPRRRTNVESAC
jgi:DUF2917 family protein